MDNSHLLNTSHIMEWRAPRPLSSLKTNQGSNPAQSGDVLSRTSSSTSSKGRDSSSTIRPFVCAAPLTLPSVRRALLEQLSPRTDLRDCTHGSRSDIFSRTSSSTSSQSKGSTRRYIHAASTSSNSADRSVSVRQAMPEAGRSPANADRLRLYNSKFFCREPKHVQTADVRRKRIEARTRLIETAKSRQYHAQGRDVGYTWGMEIGVYL